MSHTHTPVSASVIKSASRIAPRAVPRRHPSSRAQAPKALQAPPALEDGSESEGELENFLDAIAASQTSRNRIDSAVAQPTDSVPAVQLSSSAAPASNQATPVVAATVPTTERHLRSAGPVPELPKDPTSISSSLAGLVTTAAGPAAASQTRKRKSTSASGESRRRGGRGATPPGSEDVVIQPATMTMSEMCIDRRTGKKSSRYAELQEAEHQRRRLRKLKRDQTQEEPEEHPQQEESTETSVQYLPAVDSAAVEEEDDDALIPVTSATARVITDANGNIILDQSSLQIDHHAVHPTTLTETLIHTTETIFSSKVNSGTYPTSRAHAANNIRWLPADNDAFYQALQMFGTDFDLVAEWVGGSFTRRHVKNKFYREEKRNEDKLTWALKNRIPADVAELERRRGRKLRRLDEMEEWEVYRQESEAIKALPRISESQGAGQSIGASERQGKGRETLLGDI